MHLYIRTFALTCRLWGSNPQHYLLQPRPLRKLQPVGGDPQFLQTQKGTGARQDGHPKIEENRKIIRNRKTKIKNNQNNKKIDFIFDYSHFGYFGLFSIVAFSIFGSPPQGAAVWFRGLKTGGVFRYPFCNGLVFGA